MSRESSTGELVSQLGLMGAAEMRRTKGRLARVPFLEVIGVKSLIYLNRKTSAASLRAMRLLLVFFFGGLVQAAFAGPGPTPPATASAAAADPNQALSDATQNLVQALVKSVKQAESSSVAVPAASKDASTLPPSVQALLKDADATPPTPVWSVARDAQLQTVLADWCRQAGWTLVWKSEYSYRLEAQASFNGDFLTAVMAMFNDMKAATPPIYPEIYKGNRVLVVKNSPTN